MTGSGRAAATGSGRLRQGTRLAVAGRPTAEQIAALVVALDHVLGPAPTAPATPAGPSTAAPSARSGSTRPEAHGHVPGAPAWIRAARKEALGGAPAAAPDDLRDPL